MTIIEAIIEVMKRENRPLTSKEIYKRIIENDFYLFGAKKPEQIVSGTIRRHSLGIEFPTASPVKHFKVYSYEGKPKYILNSNKLGILLPKNQNVQNNVDALPEERLYNAYLEHKKSIQQVLLDKILDSDPAFFEQLVLDLLYKMGYGGNDPKSVLLVGGPHDGGIDGIIKEDKLGLSKIYIQAKRYARENTVGKPQLQQFVGAMENVQKGVFITTSSFSIYAKEYVKQKNIIIIDGNDLTELMVTYNVGLSIVRSFSTYRIDSDYFA